MPTLTQLIADIDARYTSSFTTEQKVYWMDRVQKEIFQKAPHDAAAYDISLADGTQTYALPSTTDANNITQFLIEKSTGSGTYRDIAYKEFDPAALDTEEEFVSIYNGYVYVNPTPDSTDATRVLRLYFSDKPTALDYTTLTQVPDMDTDFQDLLVFGTLISMAEANQDIGVVDVYSNRYNLMLRDYILEKQKKTAYTVTKDALPNRGSNRRYKASDDIKFTLMGY